MINRPRNYKFAVVGMGKGELPFHSFKETDEELLRLVPEDDNPFDKRAIGVWIGETKVGYVSRDNNKMIRRILKRQDKGHIMDYILVKTYSYSAHWLIVDLTLSINRKNNV